LVDDLRLRPSTLQPIFIRGGRIECLDVKILNVGAVIGKAPSDAVVVADDDHWCTGQGEAFGVPAGRSDVNLIPDGWNGELEMGVIRQQGLPGGGMGATHDPVVAAKTSAHLAL